MPTETGRHGSKSDRPSSAPAPKGTLKQQDVKTAPRRGTTPAAAGGSGDAGRATAPPARPKPPPTSHAKNPANVIYPVVRYPPVPTDKTSQAHHDAHIPDKSGGGGKGRPAVPPPGPEAVPLGAKMEAHLVEAVEVHTRGQRENPSWFAWRQNRITASAAHRISHSRFVNGKSQTPPASYLAAVTGRGSNVKTRAMTWGVEMEAEAVRRYQRLKSEALGRPVRVRDCGLFIDPRRPWLAASPDGIVQESNGERLLTLEVKCPYKHRQNTVAQACLEDRTFCLELLGRTETEEEEETRYRLKRDHGYYTQVQCQMAVTELHRADLVVFTLKETAIVPVEFDPEFWENTLVKLERFYTGAVLPLVGEKRLDAPAMKPEE